MEQFEFFIPITKMDVVQRQVWGRATQEVLDRVKPAEIFDYASSVPYFKSWSDGVEKDSMGKSKGNVRSMHRPDVASGKVIAIDYNDDEKAIDVGTYIADDQDWEKCLQGVYTGFSVGGDYAKRWPDAKNPGAIRYTANPKEISLVDRPAVPTATFAMVKADGTTEEKHFAAVEESVVEEKVEIAKSELQKLNDTVATLEGRLSEVERLHKREDEEKEKILADLTSRGKRVGIVRRSDEPLGPSEGYPSDSSKYGDPANWGWPCDSKEHLQKSLACYNEKQGREKYAPQEWNILGRRITRMASGFGLKYRFSPTDQTVQRMETKKMLDLEKLSKADVANLLSQAKDTMASAIETIGKDPTAAENMLTQVVAALDVFNDVTRANVNEASPHGPSSGAEVGVVKAAATTPTATDTGATATGSSPSSSATPTPTATATKTVAETPSSTAAKADATETPTKTATETATGTDSDEIKACRKDIRTLTEQVQKLFDIVQKPAPVEAKVVKSDGPLGDLNALVTKIPEDAVATALAKGDIATAIKESGGNTFQLYEHVDDLVRKSLMDVGITSRNVRIANYDKGQ